MNIVDLIYKVAKERRNMVCNDSRDVQRVAKMYNEAHADGLESAAQMVKKHFDLEYHCTCSWIKDNNGVWEVWDSPECPVHGDNQQ